MVMLLTEEEIGEGQRWLRLWGRGWAVLDLTVGSCGVRDAREGRHEQGTQGCSSNGSKEAAIGKEGEKERWQRRLQQRHGCVAAAASREIVYPCILYPDGEDEGDQASSSLAVSTRWISAVKLLQSDLATLAQREGGE
ncbi:hypothetical protein BHM03_00061628 [Ensete ventricosum]|nr:hypothetical protein BHM03_00061628 [Ensete ventricosum]